MKLKYCLVLLVISALLFQAYCQRGGGGSRSSFGRSRSFSRGYSGSRRTGGPSKPMTASQAFLVFGIFVVGGVCWAYSEYKARGLPAALMFLKNRKKEIKKVTDQFLTQYQSYCCLTQQQRNEAIDWFMGRQWKIQYKTSYGTPYTFDLTMTDLMKRNDNIYDFEATGSQEDLGESAIKGILLFQNDYLSICFDKLYKDRQKAGQFGKWDLLIYQGTQRGQIFTGKWYYQGFQNDQTYSGDMRMLHD